jgi:predicted RNase H-like HicB family nuclease
MVAGMKAHWIERDGQVIDLPNLTSLIEKDGAWFVSRCPELDIASQGRTRTEAHAMLAEAVGLWLEAVSAAEIKRRLRAGARVRPLSLAQA